MKTHLFSNPVLPEIKQWEICQCTVMLQSSYNAFMSIVRSAKFIQHVFEAKKVTDE